MEQLEVLMTASEVAAVLRVHTHTIYKAVADGELVGLRIGRALWFERAAVDAYKAGLRGQTWTPPTPERPRRRRPRRS